MDNEDLQQEAQLLRLQGITPNLSLLRKRMAHEMDTFDELPFGAAPIFDEPGYDYSVTEQLVTWALEQSIEISDRVLEFLEDPSEEELPDLLSYLKDSGVKIHKVKKNTQSASQVLLRALKVRPHDPGELVEIIRSINPSRRPEALVRQFLRRYQKLGYIDVIEDRVYLEKTNEEF